METTFPLSANFSRSPKGYECTFMHTGQANGWNFTAPVLQAAASLAENTMCFIDHNLRGKSVRDLAGVFTGIRFEGETLVGTVTPTGPAAGILRLTADILLAGGAACPNVGLSPVIRFSAQEKEVMQILAFQSIDLVIEPAFQTRFLSEIFSKRKEETPMTEETKTPTAADERENAIRQVLLDASLQAASLPKPFETAVRARFQQRPFTVDELQAEIQALKDGIDELAAPQQVNGPTRINAMFNSHDQIQAAVYDMFGVGRDPGTESLQVQRLSGIRELYLGLTGDTAFHGAVHPELAAFQHTTSTFTSLVKNALNKALVMGWTQFGKAGYDWWQSIARIEHFTNLNTVTWLRLGTIASLPTIAEGADYTELYIGDAEETSSWEKAGGFIGVTLEAILRDDTRRIAAIPVELGKAAIRNISENIAEIFTANSGVGPTLADGGALFNATAVTSAGGHANLLTTALSATQWDTVAAAVFNQPLLVDEATGYYGTGKKQAVEPRFCLVPRALKKTAFDAFLNAWDVSANVHAENLLKGSVVPLIVPEWTDATDWAAVCDPVIAPAIMIGEIFGLQPEIFIAGSETDPAVFTNDESRFKIRHFLTYGVADFRPLHKSNVAG